MSVKNQHKAYQDMLPKWQRCRDVAAGQDAIHAAGTNYLPKLKDQSSDDYLSYVLRATFYNATWRTIVGLQGMLFRKPPTVDVSATVNPMLDDVTMGGVPLRIFALSVTEECLVVGRCGLFVDYPVVDAETMTLADAKAFNLRPSMSIYKAEAIINWRTRIINNKCVLSQVVLQEVYCEQEDEFTDGKPEDRYRVLDLVDMQVGDTMQTVYRIRLFKVNDKGDDEQIGEDSFPHMGGKTLDYIPFYFIGVDDTTPEVDEPPLLDLVDMNLAHYRVSADYEHGCHFTGLATAVISGYSIQEGEKLYIGSQSAWVFPDPNATATFLSLDHDFVALAANIEKKEQQMAILGARMLEQQKRAAESADMAAIHRTGEQATLASAAQSISMGIRNALQTFSNWAGATGEVKFDLNRDFFPMPMDAPTLTALIAGWQQGAYSYDTLFANLKLGEVVALESTAESEQEKIQNATPVLNAPLAA